MTDHDAEAGDNSLRGHLLIATTSLKDPNFFQTVVLIVQHNQAGALGLVLNRPTAATIGQVWKQIKDSPCEAKGTLYLGGPIEGPLVALHTDAARADLEIGGGLYYTIQPEQLEQLVAEGCEPIRFVAGYAGWGAGQLEAEIAQGAWHTLRATADHVFRQETRFWEQVTKEHADATLVDLLKIKHVPANPMLN
jgi:putative transcriptional regulator